jgi:hypothetical protein
MPGGDPGSKWMPHGTRQKPYYLYDGIVLGYTFMNCSDLGRKRG